jgi:hypothetical protein
MMKVSSVIGQIVVIPIRSDATPLISVYFYRIHIFKDILEFNTKFATWIKLRYVGSLHY